MLALLLVNELNVLGIIREIFLFCAVYTIKVDIHKIACLEKQEISVLVFNISLVHSWDIELNT